MNPNRPSAARAALAASVLAAVACSACGQSNIEKLKQMKVASSDLNIPLVPQTGKNADAIRANLKRVKLPPGFRIDLYAVVPDARDMAVAPATNMLFVGTRKTTVWAVTNRNNGDAATEVKAFAPSLNFKNPNGVCWTKDGMLVVAEHNRVLMFPAAEFFYESPDVAVAEIVPQGKLVPPDEESFNHGARVCRVGPDNKLYVTVGQPFNVPPHDKIAMYRELGIGGIVRMNLDGTGREVYAVGVRNSVGMDFSPKDRSLWFTDNQTDGMGDSQPPGELNHAPRQGMDFGYPYWNGHVRVAGTAAGPDLKDLPEPKNATFPQVEFPAHQAQLGMVFYNGTQFPEHYRGGIFVASHGSWNSTVPTGALVDFVPLAGPDKAGTTEIFADDFRDANNTYTGRPVDVAVLHDGSLLISDDYAGAIYRVTYSAP
jgi:glucose/arabinose dehydrogenase